MTRATDTEQQASEWIIRSEAGSFTEERRAEMERWLLNPHNRVTYTRIKEAWRRAGRVRRARPLDGNVNPDLLKDADLTFGPREPGSASQSPLRITAAVGGFLILYLSLAMLGRWGLSGPAKWTSYSTGIGSYEDINLPDGSLMQLNTNTAAEVRITGLKREVHLSRGEVAFSVKSDYRPFSVQAGETTSVRARPLGQAGSAFAVRLRAPTGVDVSVSRGSVRLASTGRMIDLASTRASIGESTVEAGQVANIRATATHVERVSFEEIERRLSWTRGFLLFQGETLTEVTDEFNRYNRKHLVVVDPWIANRRIGGHFLATDPESFVAALRKSFGIRADEQVTDDPDNGVIRLSRAQ